MINGQGLTDTLDEKKTESYNDFSFQGGVIYIPYAQRDIFAILSLSSFPFANGSLSVDGVTLTPAGFTNGIAKLIKLSVKDTGSLTLAIFYPGKEEEAEKSFAKLTAQLKALKFPAKDEESKKDKLVMLKTVLSLNPISYVLIDLNDPLTQKNRVLWELLFLDYKGTVFFLSKAPEKAPMEPHNEKASPKKTLYLPYRIPLLFTSFFVIFLSAFAQSLKTSASPQWGLALGGAVVFLTANFVTGMLLSKKTIVKEIKREPLTSFELVNTACNVIGIAIALFTVWLLSSKINLLADGIFKGLGLAMMTLLGSFLFFSQFICGHATLIHIKETGNKSWEREINIL